MGIFIIHLDTLLIVVLFYEFLFSLSKFQNIQSASWHPLCDVRGWGGGGVNHKHIILFQF